MSEILYPTKFVIEPFFLWKNDILYTIIILRKKDSKFFEWK